MMSYRDYKGGSRSNQSKRSRNRNNGGYQGNNNNNPNRPRVPNRMQTFDSSGPNVKIRGNAYQVFERYVAMAREAAASGDRIAAENFYQHAEHYFRIMNADGQGNPLQQPRPMTPADQEMTGTEPEGNEAARGGGQVQTSQASPPPSNEPDSPPS
jgi:hypothetical protein